MDFLEDGAEDVMSEYADRFRRAATARYRRARAGRSAPATQPASNPPPPPPAPSSGLDSIVQQANAFLGDPRAKSMIEQAKGAMQSGGGGASSMMQQAMGAVKGGGGDVKKAISASGFARTIKKGQAAVTRATQGVASRAGSLYLAIIVLLLLFILHQLFIWIDADPDIAFERAAVMFDVAEVTWDMTRILWNGGVDIFNAGVIPLWNTATYYLIEPTVILALEVFSLIFMKQPWEGVMTEADFPYNGLDCMASPESAAWCGRYGFYQAQLQAPQRAEVFVNESQSFARRMMLEVPDDHHYTFGLATARRLQELSGGGFSAPSFSSGALTSALNELSVFFITMVPSFLDVVFGVLGDIIKTSFSVLMDALFMVLKSLMFVLKMLISKLYATRTTDSQHLGHTGRKRLRSMGHGMPRAFCSRFSRAHWANKFALEKHFRRSSGSLQSYKAHGIRWPMFHFNLYGSPLMCLPRFVQFIHPSNVDSRWARHSAFDPNSVEKWMVSDS